MCRYWTNFNICCIWMYKDWLLNCPKLMFLSDDKGVHIQPEHEVEAKLNGKHRSSQNCAKGKVHNFQASNKYGQVLQYSFGHPTIMWRQTTKNPNGKNFWKKYISEVLMDFFFILLAVSFAVNRWNNYNNWSCNISTQQNRQWKDREWSWKERQRLEQEKNRVWGWWWRRYWVVLGVCHTKTEAVKWC